VIHHPYYYKVRSRMLRASSSYMEKDEKDEKDVDSKDEIININQKSNDEIKEYSKLQSIKIKNQSTLISKLFDEISIIKNNSLKNELDLEKALIRLSKYEKINENENDVEDDTKPSSSSSTSSTSSSSSTSSTESIPTHKSINSKKSIEFVPLEPHESFDISPDASTPVTSINE